MSVSALKKAFKTLKTAQNLNSKSSRPSKKKYVSPDNLGQNIVDKFTKLSEISAFIACIGSDFSQNLGTTVTDQSRWLNGYSPVIPNISDFCLKLTFFKSEVVQQFMRQLLLYFLVKINKFRFLRGERKLCYNKKKSPSIFSKIVGSLVIGYY